MARARLVAKSLSTSERYARLHEVAGHLAEFAQALFPLLVAHSDDFGRLAGDTFTIKHAIVPTSPRTETDVAMALEALDRTRLIRWYAVNDRKWIEIQQFDRHQGVLHKRTKSDIPDPPPDTTPIPGSSRKFRELPGTSRKLRETPGNSRSRARADLDLNRSDLNGIQRKNAPPALARPVETVEKSEARPQSEPKVSTLAAMIREELLPLRFVDDGELLEAAKQRAATLHLAYSGSAIRRALDSARAQVARERLEVDHAIHEQTADAGRPARPPTGGFAPVADAMPDELRGRLRELKDRLGATAAPMHATGGTRRRSRHA